MSVYFDASVLVSMFVDDALSARADAFIAAHTPSAIVSDFARAEFASALGIKMRRGDITSAMARAALGAFDVWRAGAAASCELTTSDIAAADAFLRRLDLPLRVGDAIHLAIAERLRASIATFDAQFAVSAEALGVIVAPA